MDDTTEDEVSGSGTDTHLDIEAEQHRLDELGTRIQEVRDQAGEDLEPGGKGWILPDEHMHREAVERGDAPLHPGDD